MTQNLRTPTQVFHFLKPKIHKEQEELWVLACNAQLELIQADAIFRGTVDHCLFHPRDVVRFLVLHNTSQYFVAHNHPTGSPEPSRKDLTLTRKLVQLSHLIEIPLLDHIILAPGGFCSLAERGSLFSKRPADPFL